MNKCQWTLMSLFLCLVTVAVWAQPPQRRGGGAAGDSLLDEFMPVQPGARGGGPPPGPRGGQTVPPVEVPIDPAARDVAGVDEPNGPAVADGFAAPTMSPLPNRMFLAIDANNDGVINAQELRRAAAALRVLDADGDGNITLAEISPPMGPAGPMGGPVSMIDQMLAQYDANRDGQLTPNEVQPPLSRMFPQWDANGDGVVTREELTAAAANGGNQFGGPMGGGFNPQQNGMQMMQQMRQFDRNGDGYLTPNEVPPQMAGMLQGADRNGDGAIDAQEMAAALGQMGQQFGGRGPVGGFPPGGGPPGGPRGDR
jgi:Ca2+-binding EF-hand superfamily protein